MRNQKIGFVGEVDDKKVFFDGVNFVTEINGKTLAIDWDRVDNKRKSCLAG